MFSNNIFPEMPQAPRNKISKIWGDFWGFLRKPDASKIPWTSGLIVILAVSLAFFILKKNKALPGTH